MELTHPEEAAEVQHELDDARAAVAASRAWYDPPPETV
jgi:hypothetical protein